MKKSVAILLVAIMALGLFAGCGKKEDTTKIGILLPTKQEERWVRDGDRMAELAEELGVEVDMQYAGQSANTQSSQAKDMLTKGVDVIILGAVDSGAAAAIVDEAAEEGVPVISYDRLIMGTDNLDVYISFDNVAVGRLQGEYITSLVPEGKYIIMSGSPTDNNAKLFKEGAMEYLQPLIDSGDITVIDDQPVDEWKPENALKIVENALTSADNDVDAILAPNDGSAGGAIQALAAQGLAGTVPITGQDAEKSAAQRIVEGTQSMTVFKDTRLLGEEAMKTAIKLANGEELEKADQVVNNDSVDVPSILLTPFAVDVDNIDEMLIDSGYLTKEDIYEN